MQKFFTIFASPEVKNRSNTSHYVFSKPKMDKKQKKSLRRHLLVIYIFYFLALAAGFIHSFVPHVSSSLATGWQAASEDIRMQENTVSRNIPTFWRPGCKTTRAMKFFSR